MTALFRLDVHARAAPNHARLHAAALRRAGFTGLILGCTGGAGAADVASFIAAGADAVVTKPVSLDVIVGHVVRRFGVPYTPAAGGGSSVPSLRASPRPPAASAGSGAGTVPATIAAVAPRAHVP